MLFEQREVWLMVGIVPVAVAAFNHSGTLTAILVIAAAVLCSLALPPVAHKCGSYAVNLYLAWVTFQRITTGLVFDVPQRIRLADPCLRVPTTLWMTRCDVEIRVVLATWAAFHAFFAALSYYWSPPGYACWGASLLLCVQGLEGHTPVSHTLAVPAGIYLALAVDFLRRSI